MKVVIGVLMILAGVVFGVWAGLVWAFIGGIVDIINEIKAADMNAMNVALGLVKMMFAGLIGWVAALVLILPGLTIASITSTPRRRVKTW